MVDATRPQFLSVLRQCQKSNRLAKFLLELLPLVLCSTNILPTSHLSDSFWYDLKQTIYLNKINKKYNVNYN